MNLTHRTTWWFTVFVAVSCLLNALFGGRMYESLCARAWRGRDWKYGYWHRMTVWFMDRIEIGHCEIAARHHEQLTRGLRSTRSEHLQQNESAQVAIVGIQ